jgi:hypothetical protein
MRNLAAMPVRRRSALVGLLDRFLGLGIPWLATIRFRLSIDRTDLTESWSVETFIP